MEYILVHARPLHTAFSTNPPTQLSMMGQDIRVAGPKAKTRVIDDDRQSTQKIMTDRLTYRPVRLRSRGASKEA